MALPDTLDYKKRAREFFARFLQTYKPSKEDVTQLAILIRDSQADGMKHILKQVNKQVLPSLYDALEWQANAVKHWNLPLPSENEYK